MSNGETDSALDAEGGDASGSLLFKVVSSYLGGGMLALKRARTAADLRSCMYCTTHILKLVRYADT